MNSNTDFILNEIAAELGVSLDMYREAHEKIAVKYGVKITALIENPVPIEEMHRANDWTAQQYRYIQRSEGGIDVGASRMEREFAKARTNLAGQLSTDPIQRSVEDIAQIVSQGIADD